MGDVGVPGVENTAGLARWIRDNDLPGAGQDLTVGLIAGRAVEPDRPAGNVPRPR